MAEDPGMPASTEKLFADALTKIADAVVMQAETNQKLANEMRVLTTAIKGAHELVQKHTEKNAADAAARNADMKRISEQLAARRAGGTGSPTS
jgi:hypothetical protein